MSRRTGVLALKFALGGVLLALLLARENTLPHTISVLGRFDWNLLPPLAGVTILLLGLSCLKWQLVLRARGARVGLLRLMGLYTIGNFFSNFLPTMVGGDLVRGYVLGRQIDSQSRSIASVFLERFTGFLALILLCAGALILRPELLRRPIVLWTSILMIAGCLCLAAAIRWPRAVASPLSALSRGTWGAKILHSLGLIHAEVDTFRKQPRAVAGAMAYSFLFHLFAGVNTFLAARAIGLEVGLVETMVLTPLILLVSAVPLTPNGLGIWEWAFSVYLGTAGALPAQGLAVALILRAESLASSIIGGLLFLAEGRRRWAASDRDNGR
ncbi:MAG: flippase-like domain-containing protein [Candidatus Eisenbacteria bacterium]|nr:flippase-like domain-containing protein [Candidatus Eisenbacteria bacterium]